MFGCIFFPYYILCRTCFNLCNLLCLRQRKLEEALLYSGQFKDAVQALLEWLRKVEKVLSEEGPVHGDLDTVMALVEQHKVSLGSDIPYSGCLITCTMYVWGLSIGHIQNFPKQNKWHYHATVCLQKTALVPLK